MTKPRLTIPGHITTLIVIIAIVAASCARHEESYDVAKNAPADSTALTPIDSLYRLMTSIDDSRALPIANRLLAELQQMEITDSLIQYSSRTPIAEVRANTDYWMGEYYLDEQRPREALKSARLALAESVDIGDKELETSVNSLLGTVYMRLGMLSQAARCLEECLKASTETGIAADMSSDLNNLAAISIAMKQYDRATDYIERAVEIEKPLGRDDVLAVRYGIAS